MILTTKGRYAVMAILDIAAQYKINGNIPRAVKISEISERQDITSSYLEQILNKLKTAKVVKSVRGPGGGYMLNEVANKIKISQIINAVEEPIKIVRCTHKIEDGCMSAKGRCSTHDLWEGLGNVIESYFSNITLQDILDKKVDPKSYILSSDDMFSDLQKKAQG